ncbi:unnamed protein product [Dovyalis caffra]|uniref:Uncharacterized protein n=1 Tax=Dovyalis caffra TaxID=77055 RepID=A0AAV1SGR3_9ROSI|nr:unnamed protein product [Dovyalis caffra]
MIKFKVLVELLGDLVVKMMTDVGEVGKDDCKMSGKKGGASAKISRTCGVDGGIGGESNGSGKASGTSKGESGELMELVDMKVAEIMVKLMEIVVVDLE